MSRFETYNPAAQTAIKADQEQQETDEQRQERGRQEITNFFQKSADAGVAAYAELEDKVPEDQLKEVYQRGGSALERQVRIGALRFGSMNFTVDQLPHTPREYINAFRSFIAEEIKLAADKPVATPEDIQKIKEKGYQSSVDSKIHKPTDRIGNI